MKVELERLKASRSAAGYDPEDLPGSLSEADAAVRVGKGKTGSGDQALRNIDDPEDILELKKGQVLCVVGKSEVNWATRFHRSRADQTTLDELLSYARQVVAVDAEGQLVERHAGHPGDGPHMPMFAKAPEDLTVSVQPGDLVLRFDDPDLDTSFVDLAA